MRKKALSVISLIFGMIAFILSLRLVPIAFSLMGIDPMFMVLGAFSSAAGTLAFGIAALSIGICALCLKHERITALIGSILGLVNCTVCVFVMALSIYVRL